MRALYFIALVWVVLSIIGWQMMPVTTITEQIYGISALMASIVAPYIIVRLIEGFRK